MPASSRVTTKTEPVHVAKTMAINTTLRVVNSASSSASYLLVSINILVAAQQPSITVPSVDSESESEFI